MAKQKKQKQRDSRPPNADGASRPDESCCCTVRNQKLCIAVDVAQQRIYGYTELTVVAPKSGVIGLHARGLHVEKVLLDGSPASFELQQVHRSEKKYRNGAYSPSSPSDAADVGYPKYVASLEEEMVPELLIPISETAVNSQDACQAHSPLEQVVSESKENGDAQTTPETKPEVPSSISAAPANERLKLVHVQYWVEKPGAGAYFHRNVFHTNSQLRRARCWFPCVDSTSERCCYYLEFTVPSEYIAVSNGKLLYQVYSGEGSSLKTYAYDLSIPTTASYISLVVAPLVVLPDRSNPMISHMCMPGDATRLQSTVSFFHLLSSTYDEYLGAPFPFGCYKQVFIDSESASCSISIGASMVTISSDLLVDDRIIDQAFNTQVKLAHALAQQWFGVFITPETPADAWLLEGLAGFLSDQFVKRYMGNNEARYRRYKANEAVCMVDVDGAPVLSWSSAGGTDQFGVEKLGALGQIRFWKATAVVQMLEKQMGPEPFKKILQRIILRAQDPVRHLRTLSTKEFRHFANKLGNLERPFLKEFFPRWVESSGCPRLRMGFAYSKRRNMVELAVQRESTAASDLALSDTVSGSKPPAPDPGWPGMMSIRVHELDGMYDHPSLPMAGDTYQLLEIQCHSKLAGRRIAKPKKGSKTETADDNVDAAGPDVRVSMESPLLWLRADPQMEYIAEIYLHQPEQMWINQLEKDRDVVGQLQAIAAMCTLPRPTFPIVTALNNCLVDSKVYCRVRIAAASALASTATEATSWTGLSHLIKFYKSRRCDADIGLPRSNDFHDLSEYLVLEAIPGAVASVRGSDSTSPVEATDFILHILKHNDNSGNQYSDVFWLASVIEAIGSLEFGQQNLQTFCKFLKQIDRFLQYDRLMPSYNGVLTISCIHTLTRLAMNFSDVLPVMGLKRLLQPFGDTLTSARQVRVTALQALLELEARFLGLDAAISLALRLVKRDPSLTVQSKVMAHVINICLLKDQINTAMSSSTLAALIEQLDNSELFPNVLLRHHVFSVLQILAGRPASLFRREDLSAIHAPTTQKGADDGAPKELKPKITPPLKITVQPPRAEPLRIRVVPVRPNVVPKEEAPTASASSGGKESGKAGPKVGKVKLRLKPASSDAGGSPVEVSVGSHEKGAVTEVAASQSPVSVQINVKFEKSIAESPASSYQGKRDEVVGASRVREEVASPDGVEEGEIDPAEAVVHSVKEETALFEPEDQNLAVHRTQEGSSIGSEGDANGFRDLGGTDAGESSSPVHKRPKSGTSGSFKSSQNGFSQRHCEMQDFQHTTDSQPEPSGGTSTASDMKPMGGVVGLKTLKDGTDGKEKDKKDRKEKKDKDRKHKKDKKKHHRNKDAESENQDKKRSKEDDIEYQERKRKRKEEKEQRKREKEEHKFQKVDLNRTKTVHIEEKPVSSENPAGSRVSKPEGDSSQKLRLKIKKIQTVSQVGN